MSNNPKTALEIAKEQLNLLNNGLIRAVEGAGWRVSQEDFKILAQAVMQLTQDWEAENQALNILRSHCRDQSQALQEAESMATEWLEKYGTKP